VNVTVALHSELIADWPLRVGSSWEIARPNAWSRRILPIASRLSKGPKT